MDWLSFVASVVHSVAWPVAIIVAVVVLKERIASLLSALASRFADLTKLSAIGVTAEFEAKAEQISDAAQKLAPPISAGGELDGPRVVDDDADRLERLADIDPRAAVLLAFIDVEAALKSAANRISVGPDRVGSANGYAKALRASGHLPADALSLIRELADMRNKVSHDASSQISREGAEAYATASLEVIRYLDRIQPQPNAARLAST